MVDSLNHAGWPIWRDQALIDVGQLAPQYVLSVDSSYQAVGFQVHRVPTSLETTGNTAVTGTSEVRGTIRWWEHESAQWQAYRELLGIGLAARDLLGVPAMRGARVRLRVDAAATRFYWYNGGGRSTPMNRILRFVVEQLLRTGIQVVECVWVSGDTFVADGTDALGRPELPAENTVADRDQWRMSAITFGMVQQWAGFTFHGQD